MNSSHHDVTRICSDLVKIRSENPPGYTDEVIEYISGFCTAIGMRTRIEKRGRRHNLLSDKPQGRLLLCGHVDVVPALDDGWVYPPYSGHVTGSHVHGRGSTDMKGGCAALLAAIADVTETYGSCPADIAFVADEEGKGEFGMEQLVGEGIIRPCDALIAEPTPPQNPLIGEKGVLRTHIVFSGASGHASLHPVSGDSAIMQACRFLKFCQTIHEREWPVDPVTREAVQNSVRSLKDILGVSAEEADRILSRVMFNPGIIRGGERANVIAQRCELDMDMRIPWGCHIDDLAGLVKAGASGATVTVLDSSEPTFSPPGWLCSLVCAGVSSVLKGDVRPGVTQAASDARYLRQMGVEVVVYGPGDLNLLHSVNESVPIQMLEDCRQVYRYVLEKMNNG